MLTFTGTIWMSSAGTASEAGNGWRFGTAVFTSVLGFF